MRPLQALFKALTVRAKMILGIGTLLGSLLILGVFFFLETRFINENTQRLVTLQDPKADAAYGMKIGLIETSFAVLSYLQDGDPLFLTRIAGAHTDFLNAHTLYMKMAQTPEETALGTRLAQEYAQWQRGIAGLIALRDNLYDKTQRSLKGLDRLDGLLNKKVQEETKVGHWTASKKLQEAAEMQIVLAALRKNLNIYLTDPEPPYEQRINTEAQNFSKHLSAYGSLSLSPEEEKWAKNLRRLLAGARTSAGELMALVKAQAASQEEFTLGRRRLNAILDNQIQFPLEKSRAAARDRLRRELSLASFFVFVLVFAAVLFGLAVAVVTTRSITGPVEHLAAGTEAAARGDLDYRVRVESPDELGKLAESFNRMLADLQKSRNELLREIQERRLTEEALRLKSNELERSNRDLEEFAYASSHDLQEPLRKIANYTELLGERSKGRLDPDAEQYLTTIVNGATRMIGQIQDLLAYSRISRGELILEATDMNLAARQAVSDLEVRIKESGAAVSVEPLPSVMAHHGQMEELFLNLIGNAMKFRSTKPPRVRISAERADAGWSFSVEDNGIGIEPQYAERIFGLFQRLHSKAEYPGTGIGLALCRKIVERHGGRLWVESVPDKGSTFHFTLPGRPEDAKE